MDRVEFFRHALRESDVEALAEVVRGVFLTTGPRTAELERALAEHLGVAEVVGVSSCTAALFLSLTALGIGPGDEVVTTPLTFIATANAVVHCGATPVFVDVEPDTGLIDPARVAAATGPRTRAVIPVHLYGAMADVESLAALCESRGLALVEDAAHAVESVRGGLRPGQRGAAAAFSFYATKNLTAGEGGAVATDDVALAARLRRLRLHGMSRSAADRYTGSYQHWDMLELGYKANLTDLQAALLLPQLARLEAQHARREEISRMYEEGFAGLAGVELPRLPLDAVSARHLFTIWVDPERRDAVLAGLQDAGVGVAVNYRPVHRLTWYRERFGLGPGNFPNAERIGDRTISLPLYPGLTDPEVRHVIESVRSVVSRARG